MDQIRLDPRTSCHGLQYHKYADDLQLYGQFDPTYATDYTRLRGQLVACLADIRIWMLKHLVKINDAKTELMLFVNPQQERLISEKPTVILGDCVVHAAKTVRLGVLQDSHLDGDAHISSIVRSCNFHLYQLARVRRYISDEACRLAVLALVVSRLDYCNALLAGVSQHQLGKLQRLQNRAARLVARPHTPPGGVVHVTPILQRLHWLPVRQRVLYKVCLLVHHCVHDVGPFYLSELLQHHVRDCLPPPPTFCNAAQTTPAQTESWAGELWGGRVQVWNSLPVSLRETGSLSDFKAGLKTYLWLLAF